MKTTTEMQLVPITKLVSYVNNARTHSPEQINKLRSSLREFGFINPVIIDRDYGVIAGHGRILAAKEEGIAEVPCVFADHLTEAQKKAYIIADNRMAMDAGWDEELLRVEIESLQAADFDPLLTGFDEKELSKLFDDGIEAKDDDFNVDENDLKIAASKISSQVAAMLIPDLEEIYDRDFKEKKDFMDLFNILNRNWSEDLFGSSIYWLFLGIMDFPAIKFVDTPAGRIKFAIWLKELTAFWPETVWNWDNFDC